MHMLMCLELLRPISFDVDIGIRIEKLALSRCGSPEYTY
jgi:hypothetical protein